MARKLRRSPPSLRRHNVDSVTDYDASPSQSPSASNEDDDGTDNEYDASTYMASESVNFLPSDPKSKALEIKGSDLMSSGESASNSPMYLQRPGGAETAFPYINIAPLPTFHGGPDECPAMHLSRFAKVCRANNASSVDMMMRIFPVTLEGEAALWYDLNIEPYPPLSWEELKSSFLDAYNKIELADQLRSEIRTINQEQEETVRSYFLRLQLLLKKWPDNELPDSLLRAIFIDGLREEFKEWMIPQKPSSLNEALRLAFGFEQVRSVRTSGKKRLLQCGFCEGPHEEQVCEVRERMRQLWKSREKKKAVDMAESDGHEAAAAAAAELVRSVSEIARNEAEVEKDGGEMLGLKKKSQCQCWKHQCGMKKLDRNLSIVSKNSKG